MNPICCCPLLWFFSPPHLSLRQNETRTHQYNYPISDFHEIFLHETPNMFDFEAFSALTINSNISFYLAKCYIDIFIQTEGKNYRPPIPGMKTCEGNKLKPFNKANSFHH